ncbi:MAG: hypothetical protein R3B13_21480 [Polyangiaceae bacterium]
MTPRFAPPIPKRLLAKALLETGTNNISPPAASSQLATPRCTARWLTADSLRALC